MSKEIRNVHVHAAPFKRLTRMLKETESIIEQDLASRVVIMVIRDKGEEKLAHLDDKRVVERVDLLFAKLPANTIFLAFKYLEFILKVTLKLLVYKADVVNCHSLWVLGVGVIAKLVRGSKLIYDPHELETERNGLKGPLKTFSKMLEKALIPFVDEVIVVNHSIAQWYLSKYKLRADQVHVVRNIPVKVNGELVRTSKLRGAFNIPDDELIFIYQGIIHKGRGIEILLEAFSLAPSNKHIVFMGFGSDEQIVRRFAEKYPNIHFQPDVPSSQILDYTSSVDVGICLIENTALSYYYALPNKLFEYLLSGIPVISSNFPEMSSVINHYKAGWLINPTVAELGNLINELSIEDVKKYKEDLANRYNELPHWDLEKMNLKPVFS